MAIERGDDPDTRVRKFLGRPCKAGLSYNYKKGEKMKLTNTIYRVTHRTKKSTEEFDAIITSVTKNEAGNL